MGARMVSLKTFALRVSKVVGGFRRPAPGARAKPIRSIRAIEISHPTNFRRERTALPGLKEEQLALMREKELARVCGVMDPNSMTPGRPALTIPVRPAGGPMLSNPVAFTQQSFALAEMRSRTL